MVLYPYDILGVAEDSTDAVIRMAYLRLVHENSPEENPEKFQRISEAYNMIKDEESRARIELFGLPVKDISDCAVTDLLPEGSPKFSRPGIEAWRKIIRKGMGND